MLSRRELYLLVVLVGLPYIGLPSALLRGRTISEYIVVHSTCVVLGCLMLVYVFRNWMGWMPEHNAQHRKTSDISPRDGLIVVVGLAITNIGMPFAILHEHKVLEYILIHCYWAISSLLIVAYLCVNCRKPEVDPKNCSTEKERRWPW